MDAVWVAGAAGFVASQVIEVVKPAIAGLRLPESSQKPLMVLVSGVVSLLIAWAMSAALEYANLLPAGNTLVVLTLTWPAAWGTYQLESRRQIAKVNAENENG